MEFKNVGFSFNMINKIIITARLYQYTLTELLFYLISELIGLFILEAFF